MRRLRIDQPDAVHHVMNRGVDRRRVFFDDASRIEFLRRLAEIHERYAVETLAYCLMDNHYHLLLRTPRAGLSDAMQSLGSVYTQHTNARIGRDGPLFRGRFHSILVTTDNYLTAAARYIHRNPLDLPGVESATGHRWSSYRLYMGDQAVPTFMNVDLLLDLYGHDRAALRSQTDDDVDIAPLRNVDALAPFVEFTLARAQLESAEAEAIRERTIWLALAHDCPDPTLRATIVEHLGTASRRARQQAVRDARLRVAANPTLAGGYQQLLGLLRDSQTDLRSDPKSA